MTTRNPLLFANFCFSLRHMQCDMAAVLCLAVFLCALPCRAGSGRQHGDNAPLLCKALQKVEAASKLSPTERYEDKYNSFAKALGEAERYYLKIVERGPVAGEVVLLSLFDDYQEAATFWRAYMNDRVFVKRRDRTWEPSYLVKRDPWPSWLEERFPGLIGATQEKGENGYYISGDKALDYIFRQLGRQVRELRCDAGS
jgi:hypothetical protein